MLVGATGAEGIDQGAGGREEDHGHAEDNAVCQVRHRHQP